MLDKDKFEISSNLKKAANKLGEYMDAAEFANYVADAISGKRPNTWYELTLILSDLVKPELQGTCEIDRRDPHNPFCRECGQDWNDEWVYCPKCGCKGVEQFTESKSDNFSFGDWVVYNPSYTKEIGRFVSYSKEDKSTAFVCYSAGCTAANTPTKYLRHYDEQEDKNLVKDEKIGYHRFDTNCPDYNKDVCSCCNFE